MAAFQSFTIVVTKLSHSLTKFLRAKNVTGDIYRIFSEDVFVRFE